MPDGARLEDLEGRQEATWRFWPHSQRGVPAVPTAVAALGGFQPCPGSLHPILIAQPEALKLAESPSGDARLT
jgi:hypothetical protein